MSAAGVPEPRLLVQRFRRGLGRSHGGGGRFGHLVSGGGLSLNQRQGTLSCGEGFSPHPGSTLLVHGAISVDNSTAVAYLRKAGGTHSSALNTIAQRILHWAEDRHIVLAPQFIMGRNNVLADSLSRPNQIQGLEWTLKMEMFLDLRRKWPVMVDLFATSSNHCCSLYFLPFHDPGGLGTDALLQCWDGLQVYAFPPWSLIPLVLKKLHLSSGVLMTLIAPYWLSDLGSPIFWRSWWTGRLCFLCVPIYSDSLLSTVVILGSTGCLFMPGDCPAICQGRRVLCACSLAGWFHSQIFHT